MEDLRLISLGLYEAVGDELGTEKVVDMRRRVMALHQRFSTVSYRDDKLLEDILLSGSECEGFRFPSSDMDLMLICKDIRVIFSLPTEEQCNDEQTLILAERALLRLLNNLPNPGVKCECVPYRDGYYVASSIWRDLFTLLQPGSFTHGPCSTAVLGTTEVDFANCVKSDKLPEEVHCFIQRLHTAGWPSASTLQRIASGGCHFVAIGAKGSPTELMEWRISFSATEKILIHSMNHVQFLCYGLLKLFLKEAIDINPEIKGLLCSYFLKTALFWEIATNSPEWNTSNFLSCFWICFQRLLHWINNAYCPNFFIPENNMFAGKVHGAARFRLLSYLVPLYQEGYYCLLRCNSIENALFAIIQVPLLANVTERYKSEKCEVEVQLILEVWNNTPQSDMVRSQTTKRIQNVGQLISTSDSELEQEILQLWRNYLIQDIFISSSIGYSTKSDAAANQSRPYRMPSMPMVDATRHLLYAALYHYQRGMYSVTISLLRETKTKLQHPYLIYVWEDDVEKYRAAGGEYQPFTQMMKEIVSWPVQIHTLAKIPELLLEIKASASHSIDGINIPPLVFTNLLYFLCYRRMEKLHEAHNMLQELLILLQYDGGYCNMTVASISTKVTKQYRGRF